MSMFDNRGFNAPQNSFSQPWSNAQQYNSYGYLPNTPQNPSSNISLVMSLEEAIYKSTVKNSDNVHFNQNVDEFYRVKVDSEGRKSWQIFPYGRADQNLNTPATKADILALSDRLDRLEGKQKETSVDAESNG